MSAPLIIISLILLTIFACAIYRHRIDMEGDEHVLRETITVNLDIMQNEIVTLQRFAWQVPDSKDKQAALDILQECAQCAANSKKSLMTATASELALILGDVFEAMVKVTVARRLLKAIGV